jgi:mannose-6-phosphate isomerase
MVWGGRRLGEILHKPLPEPVPYGESWEISDHPMHRSIVATGPWQGQSLRQLMEQHRDELLGRAARETVFPLLVKYLDACDWLSVQVHPDAQAVKKLWPGEGSKTEAWFVLDAAPGSRIYAGLLPGVGERELRAALQTGTAAECLHSFEPRPGDCVFLPAGTVHAVGGGVLIAEVQQTSDATFRLFDWNRRDAQGKARQLHIEEGLASIHWDQGPVAPVAVPEFTRPDRGEQASLRSLVRCPYFELSFLRCRGDQPAVDFKQAERPRLLLVLAGSGGLSSNAGKERLELGQTWLLPASLANVQVQGDLVLLFGVIPDLQSRA